MTGTTIIPAATRHSGRNEASVTPLSSSTTGTLPRARVKMQLADDKTRGTNEHLVFR